MSYQNPDPDRFNPIVWDIVRQIPYGQVATYGQIASMIPPPPGVAPADYDKLGPRWVGDAMNAVSRVDEPTVPWHRVINAKGGISLPEGSASALIQRKRLEAEAVTFDAKDQTDLGRFGWDGPDADWLKEHHLFAPRPLKKPPTDASTQLPLF
jgi:methylated-DNA-protein-cysteine methyltransferase-like protein